MPSNLSVGQELPNAAMEAVISTNVMQVMKMDFKNYRA